MKLKVMGAIIAVSVSMMTSCKKEDDAPMPLKAGSVKTMGTGGEEPPVPPPPPPKH